jgi:uncharacterized protein YbjT (DUF2867 family)
MNIFAKFQKSRAAHPAPSYRLIASILIVLSTLHPVALFAATPPSSPPLSVMVFGGSGQLGSLVVRAALAEGHTVSVFARESSNMQRLQGLPVTVIRGDVREAADVDRALKSRSFDIVVDALGRSESGVEFYEQAARHITRAAAATGVKHLIHHGSVGVAESRAAYPPNRFPERSPLFVSKGAAEKLVRDSGITYTIIRNAVLRPLPAGQEDRAQLLEDPLTFGAVSREGVARLTVQCFRDPRCTNRTFHAIDAGIQYQ